MRPKITIAPTAAPAAPARPANPPLVRSLPPVLRALSNDAAAADLTFKVVVDRLVDGKLELVSAVWPD